MNHVSRGTRMGSMLRGCPTPFHRRVPRAACSSVERDAPAATDYAPTATASGTSITPTSASS